MKVDELNEDELNKLILVSIGEGNGEYEHLERLIGKSRAIVQQRVEHLVKVGLVKKLMGPSGKKTLRNGLRLTEKGQTYGK